MHVFRVESRRYAQFERLRKEPGLAHAFTTRPWDVSSRGNGRARARAARRRQVAADLGFDPEKLCYCVQVHHTRLAVIDAARPSGRVAGTDAVVTAQRGVPLMVFSADCPLVLVFDRVRRVVGLVHASWRCTVAGAARRLVEALGAHFGSRPDELLAGIGPSAGPCCYEVGADVVAAAAGLPRPDELFETRAGRIYFDLWRANQAQLLAAGVRPGHVETAEVCTMCCGEWFYSFRREGAGCGHFGLLAGLT